MPVVSKNSSEHRSRRGGREAWVHQHLSTLKLKLVSVRDFAVVYAHVSLLLLSPIEGEHPPFGPHHPPPCPTHSEIFPMIVRRISTEPGSSYTCNSYVAPPNESPETNLITASPSLSLSPLPAHTHTFPRDRRVTSWKRIPIFNRRAPRNCGCAMPGISKSD